MSFTDKEKARAAIVFVLDWIDSEGRQPDWWEIANLRDAINFLNQGSADLAFRLAEYARVPQGERLEQPRRRAKETTQALRERLNHASD